jgi:ELWxxDGT repeat protein
MKKILTLLALWGGFSFSIANAQSFQLVKDLYPQTNNLLYDYDAGMTYFNNKLYFATYYGDIAVSDGTNAGTEIISNISMPFMTAMDFRKNRFVPMGGKLYYISKRNELCVTDGTAAGTKVVVDVHPTDTSLFYGVKAILGANNDKLFLVAHDGNTGFELWTSDGTANGTQLVKDIVPGALGVFPSSSRHHVGTIINNKLFFFAKDQSNGWEPWVSDGTEAGTFMLANTNPSGDCSFGMASTFGGYAASEMRFHTMNNQIYFVGYDGIYKTDGTTAGTSLALSGVNFGANQVISMHVFNNYLYFNQFFVGNRILIKSDGTLQGTSSVDTMYKVLSRTFQEFNGELYILCNNTAQSSSRDYIAKLNGNNVDSLSIETPGYFNYTTNMLQPIGNDFLYLGGYLNHAIYRYNNGANTLANTDFTSTYDNLLSTPIGTFAIGASATYGYELWKWNETAASVQTNTANESIKIYPNPFSETLNLELAENTHIKIYDLVGNMVYEQHFMKGQHPLNLKHLSKGMYFMLDGNGQTQKFIKE